MHHQVRALTKHIPFRAGATLMNVALSGLGIGGGDPKWLVSEGIGSYPAMELNVSSAFQRRMFYFPRAYWERLMGLPFGRFIERTLEPGAHFLDVGSNIGFYTLFAAQRVGRAGRVHTFEPDPGTYESLARSVRYNHFDWVRCINAALSDKEGTLPFYFVSDGSAHSLVPETPRRAKRYAGKVDVRVTTLDHLTESGEIDLPRVDLIKVDVEGEEAHTVAGMKNTLRRLGCPPVWAEVRGPRGSTRAPNTFPAVKAELTELGYRAFIWNGGLLDQVTEADVRGREDVLFKQA